MDKKKNRLLWLFGVNMFISSFTFGGGYVVVPMIRKYFVLHKNIFTEEELTEMAAVAQSAPGAIAINLSALAGYRAAGPSGAVVSCIAAVMPPFILLSVISVWYAAFCTNPIIAAVLKGMQAGVAAVIADLVADMCAMILRQRSRLLSAMMPGAFIASFFMNINVAVILMTCCALCLIRLWIMRRKEV